MMISLQVFSQEAYKGKGDQKVGIGLSIATQGGGLGLNGTYDRGLGENISIGVSSTYILGVKEDNWYGKGIEKPDAIDRFDVKGRLNVHLGNVINVDKKFDVYPGLNIGIHNLGLHTGVRYFFSKGFGLFSEFDVPVAKFDDAKSHLYYNGFKINLGVSLNL